MRAGGGASTMVDSRIVQTRAALTRTVLELASVSPISEIPVSEIARRAGVNRATFYNHYSSPGELLAAVVQLELDRVRMEDHRAREARQSDAGDVTYRTIASLVEFIEENRRVFELALLQDRDVAVHRALCSHMEVSCRQHLERFASGGHPVPDVDIVAQFVAAGIVGGIEAWLARPDVDDTLLTRAIVASLPQWWGEPERSTA
ncbi:MAG: TetR/AcrR family transcriptional regulator [Glaciihabitans sp.]